MVHLCSGKKNHSLVKAILQISNVCQMLQQQKFPSFGVDIHCVHKKLVSLYFGHNFLKSSPNSKSKVSFRICSV